MKIGNLVIAWGSTTATTDQKKEKPAASKKNAPLKPAASKKKQAPPKAITVGTFEIKRRKETEKFTLYSLELSHKECSGGKAILEQTDEDTYDESDIFCERCGFSETIKTDEYDRAAIVKMAITGGKMRIGIAEIWEDEPLEILLKSKKLP